MITVANLLSPALDELSRGICAAMQTEFDIEVWFDDGARLKDLRDGQLCVALVCGLAYSLIHDHDPERFVPVAAPVVADERSRAEPVYFSDIVVRAASGARILDDLAGTRFAYNEEISFSGYRALENELRRRGYSWSWIGERIHTGSHDRSIQLVLDGAADAAAIDSHVLLLKLRQDPGLSEHIRILDSLGPYPAPPLVINAGICGVPPERLYALIESMDPAVLSQSAIRRWQPVDDSYYDAIRTVTGGLPGLSATHL